MKKEKIDNIKIFFKENYKLIIPITLMIVLFVSFLIYYKVMISDNYREEEIKEVYQYFYDTKYEYDLTISKNRKKEIVDIKSNNIDINFDSTPIYYKDKDIVILPQNMSIVMPTLSCAEYLSKQYSYITYENNIYTLTTNKYNNKLNHYFLYDGNDLYFFIEPVTLTINNEKIELSPFSYIIAIYNNYISYYDKKTDTFKTITITSDNSTVENNYYSINITTVNLNYHGTNVILTSDIEKLMTIDEKD